jgi:hypothetical protein
MVASNSINESTTGICGFTGTAFTGTAATQHNVIIGGSTSSTLVNVAPGASGTVLTSNGASSDPSFQAVPSGTGVIQQIRTTSFSTNTTSTVLPFDNTIPQITEGKEFFTVTITPTSASSVLVIECCMTLGTDNVAMGVIALFQDATANALAATATVLSGAGLTNTISLFFSVSAASTSARTYRIRFGPGSGVINMDVNSTNAGGLFGGVCVSFLAVTEFAS